MPDVKGDADELTQHARIVISRFNELVQRSIDIERESELRDISLHDLSTETDSEIDAVRKGIRELLVLVSQAQALRQEAVASLKDVVKADALARVERRIDAKNYEQNILRSELNRILDG